MRNKFICPIFVLHILFSFSEDFKFPVFTTSYGKEVSIDGKIDKKEWEDASVYSGFMNNFYMGEEWKKVIPLYYAIPSQTITYLKWDDTNFYLGFRCHRIKGVPLIYSTKPEERDVNLTKEESIEIFLNTPTGKHYFFVGNPIGAIFDGTQGEEWKWDKGWDGNWRYKTNITDDYWEGEISISFKDLGVEKPEEGQVWKFSVCRYQPNYSRSSLTFVGGWFFNPNTYGDLYFTKKLRIYSVYSILKNRIVLKQEIKNIGEEDLKIEIDSGICPIDKTGDSKVRFPDIKAGYAFEEETFVYSKEKGKVWKESKIIKQGESINILLIQPVRINDKNIVYSEVLSNTQKLLSFIYPSLYYEEEPIRMEIVKRMLTKGKIYIKVKEYTIKEGEEVKFRLLDLNNNILKENIKKKAKEEVVFEIDCKDYKPGEYLITIESKDIKKTTGLKIPEIPEWYIKKSGYSEKIPEPFKPIEVRGERITFTFGQGYIIKGNFLPEQVISLFGNEILSGRISLYIEQEGKKREVKVEKINRKIKSERIDMKGKFKAGDAEGEIESFIEFDGLLWTKIKFTKKTSIDKLYLEIPYKKDIGVYYHAFAPDIVRGSKVLKGKIPKELTKIPFYPCVWIGDIDKGGLEWSCESFKYWKNKNDNERIEIIPEKEKIVLRINFIDEKKDIEGKEEYGFGLMPTPVRDPRNYSFWKDIRMVYSFNFGDKNFNLKDMEKYQGGKRNLSFWFYGRKAPKFYNYGVVCVYPLKGNINPEKGTIEGYIKPTIESPQNDLDILYIDLGREDRGLKLVLKSQDFEKEDVSLELINFDGSKIDRFPVKFTNWKKGEFNHIGVSWEKNKFYLYGNGEKLGEKEIQVSLEGLEKSSNFLFIGGNTQIIIDEFRVSREKGDISYPNKAKNDKNSLIVDHFDEKFIPNDYLQTKAEKISGLSGETGCWVDLWAEFVKGIYGNGIKLSISSEKDRFQLAKALGVKIFHSHYWHRGSFGCWWLPEDKQREINAKLWIEKIKNINCMVGGYYLKNISPEDPYWNDFGEEITLKPLRMSINNYVLCPNGPGRDFFVWSIEQIIKRYNFPVGIHNDYGEVMICKDIEHGCGWIDEKGNLQGTWPILAYREMNRRIYNLFHIFYPGGLYKNHTSCGSILSADSFCDYFVTGEYETFYTQKNTKPIGDWLSEDKYLTHYSYFIFGIPSYGSGLAPWNLLSGDGIPLTQTHVIELYPLIKDGIFDPYREGGDRYIRSICHIYYPALVDFATNGEFYGFWRNKNIIKFLPEDEYVEKYIKSSYYMDKKNRRLLLIVGNVGKEKKEVEVRIDWEKIGLNKDKVTLRDLGTREVYENGLKFEIKPESVRFIIIIEKK
ncbi:MAG: DUF6067 family protein [Candidatus Omnitrophica bacterium]|nr:DUF6067 family protein [Candidatus Omnitrophota bacterium]